MPNREFRPGTSPQFKDVMASILAFASFLPLWLFNNPPRSFPVICCAGGCPFPSSSPWNKQMLIDGAMQVPSQTGQAAHPNGQRHQCSMTPQCLPLGQFHLINSQVLFGSGDVLAQQAVDRRGLQKHDFGRTGRMALYGGGRPPHMRHFCSPCAGTDP